ncbi:unnamed protein product, partial [Ectocarpus sp. 12 AP-2014]
TLERRWRRAIFCYPTERRRREWKAWIDTIEGRRSGGLEGGRQGRAQRHLEGDLHPHPRGGPPPNGRDVGFRAVRLSLRRRDELGHEQQGAHDDGFPTVRRGVFGHDQGTRGGRKHET